MGDSGGDRQQHICKGQLSLLLRETSQQTSAMSWKIKLFSQTHSKILEVTTIFFSGEGTIMSGIYTAVQNERISMENKDL